MEPVPSDIVDGRAYELDIAPVMLKASADTIDYDLDENDYKKIGDLIDSMCDMSKVLNANKSAAANGKKETM